MSRILLDTSAYSAFFRGHVEVKHVLQHVDEIYLTPIVLGELHAGFQAGNRLKKSEQELDEFLSSSRVRVLTVDQETSIRYAVILNALRKAGTPVPANDLWIAASAMQHGLPLLTSDAHFLKMSQILVSFFRV